MAKVRRGKRSGCLGKGILAVVAGALALGGYVLYALLSVPDVAPLKKSVPKTTAMQAWKEAHLREAGKKATRMQALVPLSSISPFLSRAVVASEDANFYGHEGVDYDALKEAAKKDWRKRRFAMGGSTIPMQLAKNLFLSPSKNPLRKIREYFIALELDRDLSKGRILEIYLNVVEWGPGVWGAQAASRYYFAKNAADLNASEACLLAVLLPSPVKRNPYQNHSQYLVRKRDRLLRILRKQGRLSETEYRAFVSQPLKLRNGESWP